jgi:imidazolonepropionase-like amidohydrolase
MPMRVLALALLLVFGQESAPARVTAYRGAKVYTAAGAPIENATLLAEKGRILDVGKDVALPQDAAVVDLAGRVIVPGLIDAASPLLVPAGDRTGGSPEFDILDSLDRYQRDPREAVEQGVVAVYVGPAAPGGGVAGLGAVVRLDRALTVLSRRSALKVALGGEGGDVSTAAQRFEGYQQLKQLFESARQAVEAQAKYQKDLAEFELKKKQAEAEKKPSPPAPAKPKADPRSEVLSRCLDPKDPLLVRIEAHSADSIGYALRLVGDFKLRAVLECATAGSALAEEIAKAKVPVIAGPVFRYDSGSLEYLDHSTGSAAALARAGVRVAIASFGDPRAGHAGGGASRFLAESAAFAASRGLGREEALAAVTIQAARVLGIEKSHGSLEKGKSADFVVLSGEPFEAGTAVERTVLAGETAWSRPGEGSR